MQGNLKRTHVGGGLRERGVEGGNNRTHYVKVKRVILVVERLTVSWKKRGWGGPIKNVCNENSIRSLICKLVKKNKGRGTVSSSLQCQIIRNSELKEEERSQAWLHIHMESQHSGPGSPQDGTQ